MVNLKSFSIRDFLQNNWTYELTVHFKHDIMGKHFPENFIETLNKVEL